jgi:mRNA-degrading endonuclease YafQ of YafQ-DinJ toxin-antitoxin module
VADQAGYNTLEFTPSFLESLSSRRFTAADQAAVLRALRLLDTNDRHPSLRVHELQGRQRSVWSASASRSLRLHFLRMEDGRKRLLLVTKLYTD